MACNIGAMGGSQYGYEAKAGINLDWQGKRDKT